MGPKREELQKGPDRFPLARLGHGSQRCNHVQILFARQIGIEIGFLRNIPQAFSIRSQIVMDVLAVMNNLTARRLQQARQHPHGRAFSRAIWPQVAQHLSGPQTKANVLYGQHGTVELGESFRLEHGHSLQTRQTSARVSDISFDTGESDKVPPVSDKYFILTTYMRRSSVP